MARLGILSTWIRKSSQLIVSGSIFPISLYLTRKTKNHLVLAGIIPKDCRSLTFSDLRIKFGDMAVNNLMLVPIDRRPSKTKVIGFQDLQFGVGEVWVHNEQHYPFLRILENCRCTTSVTILFSESLKGVNRSCY